ncbi:MAG: FGGY family carbohydrate kinase [Kineosporiaceae bacterium]
MTPTATAEVGPVGLVGMDVGTTRVKAVAFDLGGRPLLTADVATPWQHTAAGVEMDAADLAAAIRTVVARACTALGRVAGLGVTGMGESGVLTVGTGADPDEAALAPIRAWHDLRGDVAAIETAVGRTAFESAIGMPLDPQPSLPKLLTLRAEYPRSVAAQRFWSVPEWAVRLLGGSPGSELSLASRTGLLDVLDATPWAGAIELLGADLLGEPQPAGTPCGQALGLPEAPQLRGAVLAVGGHDHQCAALAVGAAQHGTLFDSLGTAEALLRFADASTIRREAIPALTAAGLTVGRTVVAGQVCILAGLRTGMELERVVTDLGATTRDLRRALATRPEWADAVRHAIDGAATALAAIEAAAGEYSSVLAAGGWLHDPVVLAAKQAQLPGLRTTSLDEAGAAGAAYLAGIAAGLLPPVEDLDGPPWALAHHTSPTNPIALASPNREAPR